MRILIVSMFLVAPLSASATLTCEWMAKNPGEWKGQRFEIHVAGIREGFVAGVVAMSEFVTKEYATVATALAAHTGQMPADLLVLLTRSECLEDETMGLDEAFLRAVLKNFGGSRIGVGKEDDLTL